MEQKVAVVGWEDARLCSRKLPLSDGKTLDYVVESYRCRMGRRSIM